MHGSCILASFGSSGIVPGAMSTAYWKLFCPSAPVERCSDQPTPLDDLRHPHSGRNTIEHALRGSDNTGAVAKAGLDNPQFSLPLGTPCRRPSLEQIVIDDFAHTTGDNEAIRIKRMSKIYQP